MLYTEENKDCYSGAGCRNSSFRADKTDCGVHPSWWFGNPLTITSLDGGCGR